MKIAINSKTTGKFETRFLNNREHLVTNMISLVGDSVMNGGLYPLVEVQNSFDQLNYLPAPNGHPKVGNQLVSAFHPLATNAFNFGGMVRNPKMDGAKVTNEFWLDIDIANQSDDGKELIRRIEEGEEVGVSTGLNVNREMKVGVCNGQNYDWIAREMHFDHVAILLNEVAAGAHEGTALQNNSSGVMVVNCAEIVESEDESFTRKVINALKKSGDVSLLPVANSFANSLTGESLHDQLNAQSKLIWPEATYWSWIRAVWPLDGLVVFDVELKATGESKMIQCPFTVADDVVTLGDEKIEVEQKYVPVGGDADIINSPQEDNMGNPIKPADSVTNNDSSAVESAIALLEKKGFAINTKEEAANLQYFVDNKAKFESVINAEEEAMETLRDQLVANSDLEADDVKGMSKGMLERLSNSFTPAQKYNAAPGHHLSVVNSEASEDDYESDYTKSPASGDK